MRVFGGGGGGLSEADADLRYVRLSGATLTGALAFSGTNHAGIRLNALTTTERNALTPAAGHVIYNSTANRFEFRNDSTWEQMVRRSGDTLTGPLLLPDGSVSAPGLGLSVQTNTGFYVPFNTELGVARQGAFHTLFGDGQLLLHNSNAFSWKTTANFNAGLSLYRDADDTLAQRRSTNPQTLRVYGTYTDASNYERLSLTANATAITFASEAAGTGVSRNFHFTNGEVWLDNSRGIRIKDTGGTGRLIAVLTSSNETWIGGSSATLSDTFIYAGGVSVGIVLKKTTGNVGFGINDPKFKAHIAGRLAHGVPATAPTDADLSAGQVSAYLDETAHKLLFRVKYADGTTLKSGEVALV